MEPSPSPLSSRAKPRDLRFSGTFLGNVFDRSQNRTNPGFTSTKSPENFDPAQATHFYSASFRDTNPSQPQRGKFPLSPQEIQQWTIAYAPEKYPKIKPPPSWKAIPPSYPPASFWERPSPRSWVPSSSKPMARTITPSSSASGPP